MKTFTNHSKLLIAVLLYSFSIISEAKAGIVSGDSPVCPSTAGYYAFSRDNNNCSSIEWKVYENGSLKSSGWSYSGTSCTVNWSSNFSSGEVWAREKESETYGEEPYTYTYYCDHWGDWDIKYVSKTNSEPYFNSMNAAFCAGDTKTVSISSQCPNEYYDYEVPAGWKINGGSNTLNNTSSKSIQVTAPSSGYTIGTYNLKVKKHIVTTWVQKLVQLGPVQSSQVNLGKLGNMYDYTLCPSTDYAIIATGPPSTSFASWSFSGGFSSTYGYGNQAAVTTSSSYTGGYISVSASNQCGSAVTVGRTFSESYGCPYSMMTSDDVIVYPNPVESELTIEWPEEAEVTDILLFSEDKEKVKFMKLDKKSKVNKAILNLQDLPSDIYYLHLTDGIHIVKKQILKK